MMKMSLVGSLSLRKAVKAVETAAGGCRGVRGGAGTG